MKHLVVYINKADAVDDTEVLELVSHAPVQNVSIHRPYL